MYSRYHYSPSSPPSHHYAQSSAIDHSYRKALSPRSHHYQPIHHANKQCMACRHQQEISTKAISFNYQPAPLMQTQRQEYNKMPTQEEVTNLRKTLRFLQGLLEQTKQEHKFVLQNSEKKVNQLMKQIQQQNASIQMLEKKLSSNQLMQQYASKSLVGSYIDKQQQGEKKEQLRYKISQLNKKIENLEAENQKLQEAIEQDSKFKIIYQNLQPKLKEYEIYQREYESMKLLIHKMQMDSQQKQRKHNKLIIQLQQNYKAQLHQYSNKLNEAHSQIRQKALQLQQKGRQIDKTRHASFSQSQTQFQHLQELLQQKNQEVDKLQSKITCIQSELTFLKNRYGYLLKLSKTTNMQPNGIGSASDLQEYCIERVSRHNLSNAKESLIGLNLSPIKRR